jgi:hypothetical protein
MIYPKQSQNNTILTPERAPLLMTTMFTCLFEGETSSREELYYNNLQDKLLIPSTPIYTKSIYPKENLEEDHSRSGSFY